MIGIILTAGTSSRLPEFKPLLKLGDKTIIENVIANLKGIPNSKLLLILGYRGKEIEALFKKEKNSIVTYNQAYEKGMFSSVLCALNFLQIHYPQKDFFIALGDQPFIKPSTLLTLYNYFIEKNCHILVPKVNNSKGHPVFFKSYLKGDIMKRSMDDNLRAFLETKKELITYKEIDDNGILFDIDTRDEYENLKKQFKGRLQND